MNIHVSDTGFEADAERAQLVRLFQRLELRAEAAHLHRRCAIALVKMEYGLLTVAEMDLLLLEGAEFEADLELWKAYE